VARARKHAAKDELHGRRARPDRVYRGEGLEPQQEDSRNAAIKCAKVQTLAKLRKVHTGSGLLGPDPTALSSAANLLLRQDAEISDAFGYLTFNAPRPI
jgi:hypothetical protein